MIIDPRGMDVLEWTSWVSGSFTQPIQRLLDPDEWRDWARNLIRYPQVSKFSPPDPDQFRNWQEWAERFNQVITVTL